MRTARTCQTGPVDILILCTANICRSPMAEALLRAELEAGGMDARVHSAGFLYDNASAEPFAVETMRGLGLDISEHRSRIVQPDMLEQADVVLTMTRTHVRDAALKAPSSFGKIFPIKELARVGSVLGVRQVGQPLTDWLTRAAADRSPATYLADLQRDAVEDPVGGSISQFRTCSEELTQILATVTQLALRQAP